MQNLSVRLSSIAVMVPNGARVADIGTDHGYLSIFLEKNKSAKRIIACDINEKPLSVAKRNIENANCNNIETRLSDGFEKIEKNEIDIAIIAGMGGEVISGIIDRCEWIRNEKYTLILQPMTSPHELRRYLYNNKFEITEETAIFDSGKLYTVIKASYTGKENVCNEGFFYTGKLTPRKMTDYEYMKKQLRIVSDCRDSLKAIVGKEKDFLYYKKVAEEIEKAMGEK